MYLLIEGKEPTTHEMIYFKIGRAVTKRSDGQWELIGIAQQDDTEISIAKFSTQDHAYKALRQLFNVITRGDVEWDVVEFKQYLESEKPNPESEKPNQLKVRAG